MSITERDIEGDWTLRMQDDPAEDREFPSYTFRAGQVFYGGQPEAVGEYHILIGAVTIVLAGGEIIDVHLSEGDVLVGAIASPIPDGHPLVDPVTLVRVGASEAN